eukprot:1777236-Pleurochrysis_carterae.AAC.3
MVTFTYLGMHGWFFEPTPPTAAARILGTHATGRLLTQLVIGELLFWDTPTGFTVKTLRDPLMLVRSARARPQRHRHTSLLPPNPHPWANSRPLLTSSRTCRHIWCACAHDVRTHTRTPMHTHESAHARTHALMHRYAHI